MKQFQLLHWSITTQLGMDITTVQTSFYIDANKQQHHTDTGHARLSTSHGTCLVPLARLHHTTKVEYSSIAALRHLLVQLPQQQENYLPCLRPAALLPSPSSSSSLLQEVLPTRKPSLMSSLHMTELLTTKFLTPENNSQIIQETNSCKNIDQPYQH
jgi:hypothetical protein